MFLICVFLIISNVEHFLYTYCPMYVFFGEISIQVLCPFLIIVFQLSFKNSLCILEVNSLSNYMVEKNYSISWVAFSLYFFYFLCCAEDCCSIICNRQYMGIAYKFFDRQIDKEYVVCTMEYYTAIENGGNLTIYHSMNGPEQYYAKWNKSVTEGKSYIIPLIWVI